MAKLLYGDRIGRTARLSPGCSAIIFDPTRQKVLLTRRSDNGQWCLPSGGMEPGESISETCLREVREETGLQVRIRRLVGVYTDPHMIAAYPDGNRWQMVGFGFECDLLSGEPQLSDETTAVGFFSLSEIEAMDVMAHHRQRILDALPERVETLVK